jgi:hypothetical protein
MYFAEMNLYSIYVDKMPVYEIAVDVTTIDKKSADEMTVDQMACFLFLLASLTFLPLRFFPILWTQNFLHKFFRKKNFIAF